MRLFLALLFALFASAATAQQDIVDTVSRQLRGQGYDVLQVETTLLGRLRFVAARGSERREIVINPANGLILRDYNWSERGGSAPVIRDRREDDRRDDRDDDDDDGRDAREDREDDRRDAREDRDDDRRDAREDRDDDRRDAREDRDDDRRDRDDDRDDRDDD